MAEDQIDVTDATEADQVYEVGDLHRERPLELKQRRNHPTPNALRHPPLTEKQILEWADAHYQRVGRWPTSKSGRVADAPGITWRTVHRALAAGGHSLPGGNSLSGLLERTRAARKRGARPALAEAEILEWAYAHFQRTGRWPTARCGAIAEAPGETWQSVNAALMLGKRCLSGGSSLPRLLESRAKIKAED